MSICLDCNKKLIDSWFDLDDNKFCYKCYKIRRGPGERCYVCDKVKNMDDVSEYKYEMRICDDCNKFDETNNLCDSCLKFKPYNCISYDFDGEHEICNECRGHRS